MKSYYLLIFLTLFIIIDTKTNDEKVPFTAEDMHVLNRAGSFVSSLDKKYIVYMNRKWFLEEQKYKTNLMYLDAPSFNENKDNSVVAIELTKPEFGVTDSDPMFSSEFPEYIFFLRTKEGRTHLYYMDFPPKETSEPIQLSQYVLDISNPKFLKNTFVFSVEVFYDCEDFDCTKKRNDEIEARGPNTYSIYTKLMMRHWDIWYTEGKAMHPFYQKINKVDGKPQIDSTAPLDLMKSMEYCSPPIENGAEQFSISANGNLIAFSAHKKDEKMSYSTEWDIYLYDLTLTENNLVLLTKDEAGRCQNPVFHPTDETNSKLAYLCMLHYGLESDELNLRIYDPSTKTTTKESFKKNPAISGYMWHPSKENTFIINAVHEGRIKLITIDISKATVEEALTDMTLDSNGYSLPIIISSDETKLVCDYSSYTTPSLIGILTLNNETKLYTAKVYFDPNEEVMTKFEMVEPEWFDFIGAKDERVQGWFMKPVGYVEGKKYPLAYLIHGGPEGAWDPLWSYRWNPNLWTNHGYAVVMINPHGSSGMGIDFQNAVRYDWGGAPFQDIMKGLDYTLNAYPWIDKERVGGCGASYGGFMVNWIQGHNDEKKFKCLVTHDGVFSTITMFYATEEMWFPMSEYCPHDGWGCKPYNDDERKGFEDFNPEYFVDHWNTPHLIIHGSKDYRIPITEGISAFTSLQIRGVPSRFLHFPDENHWVLNPTNSIKWYEEVLGWLDKYLENN